MVLLAHAPGCGNLREKTVQSTSKDVAPLDAAKEGRYVGLSFARDGGMAQVTVMESGAVTVFWDPAPRSTLGGKRWEHRIQLEAAEADRTLGLAKRGDLWAYKDPSGPILPGGEGMVATLFSSPPGGAPDKIVSFQGTPPAFAPIVAEFDRIYRAAVAARGTNVKK